MPVLCDGVADLLADAAKGDIVLPGDARLHVEHCLRCQAEVVQYRKLLRALRTMRVEILEPAPGLLAEVLMGLEAAGERHALRSALQGKKVAYVGGIAAAATAAAAGGAIVLVRTRARRLAS